jgi:hypothetical protein
MKKYLYSPGYVIILAIIISSLTSCNKKPVHENLKYFCQSEVPQQTFGIKKLSEVASLELVNNADEANILIISSEELSKNLNLLTEFNNVTSEGFSIKKLSHKKIAIISTDPSGSMYGILDVAEQIEMGKSIRSIEEKTINPKIPFRAIKFNLPWNSYRVHESLQLHTETVRDLEYWKSFLDMMAENHFNALTLWNLHPFPYMIRAKNYPEACPFSDVELASWQKFWHGLFQMAKDRGIKTFIMDWNIFVSPSFAKKYGVADYCLPAMAGKEYFGDGDYSPLVQKYNRESITQLINEYPELTGFGVSQNERMEGVPEQVWQDWIVNTYFDAMDSADHKIEFIMRAHTHPAPELTRKAVEDNAYRLGKVWVDVKFNWSHAHATPKLMYIHGGSKSTALWKPTPKNYKMVYTMRNEDFFILRWGQPDFVRDVIKYNDKDYLGGYIIGSETYIPAKEYTTKPGPHLTWKYAFEKQWMFYQVWGRLLYNPETKDDVFSNSFNKKYGIDFGNKLVEAHKLSDKMPLKLASFYAASWDFTLYSEGFLAGARSAMGCLYDQISPFISVNEIINTVTLDTSLVSIKDYISGNFKGSDKINPLQLAEGLEKDANNALVIVQKLKTDNPTLVHEISDIKTWSYLSLYFSEKLKGGTALAYFRKTGDPVKQKESIDHLETALGLWEKIVDQNKPYFEDIPLLHLGDIYNNGGDIRPLSRFSWAYLTGEVKNDIDIAKNSVQTPDN